SWSGGASSSVVARGNDWLRRPGPVPVRPGMLSSHPCPFLRSSRRLSPRGDLSMRDFSASVQQIAPKLHESAAVVVPPRNVCPAFLGGAAIIAALLGFVVGCAEQAARENARNVSVKTARPPDGTVISSDSFAYGESVTKSDRSGAHRSSPGLPPGAQAKMM